MHLDQDMIQLWAAVKKVMNLWVSKMAGSFMTS